MGSFAKRFCGGLFGASVAAISMAISTAAWAEPREFNVPAEDAVQAIPEFARQAGLQIIAPAGQLRGVQTPAVRGTMEPRDALRQLLAGTGLEVASDDGRIITLRAISPTRLGADGQASSEEDEEIVVTGTRLRGVQSASSVIELDRQDFAQSGAASIEQVMNTLPQNYNGGSSGTVALQGPAVGEFAQFVGNATPSLRGLGDATLTLVNGRRLSRTGGANGADLSSVPLGAVERIEVVPDGASSIYGADAIAGVVNIILRDDFEGVETAVAISAPIQDGGGVRQSYSLLGGLEWGSGNAILSGHYEDQDPLFARDRDISSGAADPTTLIPSTVIRGFTGILRQNLSPRLTAYAEAIYSRREGESEIAFSSPGYSFTSLSDHSSEQFVANVGLEYDAASGWVWSVNANAAQNRLAQTLFFTYLGSTFPGSISEPTDAEQSLEVQGNGELFSWSAGSVTAAFGGGARRETLDFEFPLSPGARVSGERDIRYAFAEVATPLVRPDRTRLGMQALELTASIRYDDYSDFGDTLNPKIGVIYTPTDSFRLRATYGTSFRAPLLLNLASLNTGWLFFANDPGAPGGQSVGLYYSGGNPALQPETSTSWSTTIDFTPPSAPGLRLSATYFELAFDDKILAPVTADYFSVPLSDATIAPFVTFGPSLAEIDAVIAQLASFDNLADPSVGPGDVSAILDNRFTNVSSWQAEGIDLQGRYSMSAFDGDLEFSGDVSFLNIETRLTPSAPLTTFTGTVFNPPEVRGRVGATWSGARLSLAAFVNYTGSSTDNYSSPTQEVGAFTTLDLNVGLGLGAIASDGEANTNLSFTMRNALDTEPPEIEATTTTYPGIGFDSANASAVGRTLVVQLTRRW